MVVVEEYSLIIELLLLFFLGVVYLDIDWLLLLLLLSFVAGENGGVGIYAEPFNADTARRFGSYDALLLCRTDRLGWGSILLFNDEGDLPLEIFDALRIAVELLELLRALNELLLLLLLLC